VIVRCAVWLIVLGPRASAAQETPSPDDQNRFTVTLAHPIAGPLSGAGYFAVYDEIDRNITSWRLSTPSVTYKMSSWFAPVAGIVYIWNDGEGNDNSRELRPYAGVRVSVPNQVGLHLYNLTRVEWRRITDTSTDTVQRTQRLRSRFSVEFPLSTRAWEPHTYFGSADVEPFVDLDGDFVETLRFSASLGYIVRQSLRLEVGYTGQSERVASGDPLAFNGNFLVFNVRFSLRHGLLEELVGSAD